MNKRQIQESEYFFPYHYSPLYLEHSQIPYIAKIDFVKKIISMLDFKSMADVGCGDGFLIYSLKSRLQHKVNPRIKYIAGYDVSESALRFARAFNPEIKFKTADITQNKLDQKFDLLTLIDVIEHLPKSSLKDAVPNLAKSLNQNGLLLITVPSTEIPLGHKHYQHFNKQILENYFSEHFTLVRIIGFESFSAINHLIFNLHLFLANTSFPLKTTRFKKIYFSLVSSTKKYYDRHILRPKNATFNNLLAIYRLKNK